MNAFSRSLALRLIAWCAALLPADRASWAAAMRVEVDMIEDDGAALSFALGCIWGAIKGGMFTWAFAARSMRFATIGGMLALSMLSALMTKRMIDAHAQSGLVFGLIAVLFAAATMWSYVRGPMALVRTACSAISISVIAYAFLSSGLGIAGGWGDVRLYRALAIEGMVIWTALLMGAVFMLRVEALPNPGRL